MRKKLSLLTGRSWFVALALPLLVLISMSIATIQAAPAEQATGAFATVTAGRLNVRTGPSVGYPVIEVLDWGQQVELLGRNTDSSWAQVRLLDGTVGWVGTRYIQSSVPLSSLPVTGGIESFAVVGTGALNVRSGPGTAYNVLTSIRYGDGMNLLGRSADGVWVQVSLPNGMEGWVNRFYILSNVPISSLPLVTDIAPPPTPTPSTGAPSEATPSAGGEPIATVTTGALNVRSGPGIGYEVITIVYEGDRLTLIGRNANTSWIQIRLPDGREGWVGNFYIRPETPLNTLPVTSGTASEPVATVTTGSLNVRAGPGSTFAVLTVVNQYQQMNMTGRNSNGSWVRVRVSGIEGWVSSAYITSSTPISSLPVVSGS